METVNAITIVIILKYGHSHIARERLTLLAHSIVLLSVSILLV